MSYLYKFYVHVHFDTQCVQGIKLWNSLHKRVILVFVGCGGDIANLYVSVSDDITSIDFGALCVV